MASNELFHTSKPIQSAKEKPEAMSLKLAKKELRQLMKAKLTAIPEKSLLAQSAALFEKLKAFRPYQESKRVGVYLSMNTGEIQTDAIVRHALQNGKQVFVPYLMPNVKKAEVAEDGGHRPKTVMEMVELHSVDDYTSLKKDAWGIPSIGSDMVKERESILEGRSGRGLDLILLPGVAFDIDPGSGIVRRLGHGKGFYDFFLESYERAYGAGTEKLIDSKVAGNDVLLYGLALDEQFLRVNQGKSVPIGRYDRPLHGLLIGNGEIIQADMSN